MSPVSRQERADVDADPREPLRVRWPTTTPYEAVGPAAEHRLGLDDIGLDPTGNGDDLVHPAYAVRAEREVDDQVDCRRNRRHDEARPEIMNRTYVSTGAGRP